MVDPKKRDRAAAPQRLRMAAIGMEAECALLLDGQPTRPETLFGSPRDFIRGELMHRQGTSYHLPTGGAVYFDTGVIEVATPVIEIERGCAARAGRSLWEALQFIRGELDAWDARKGPRDAAGRVQRALQRVVRAAAGAAGERAHHRAVGRAAHVHPAGARDAAGDEPALHRCRRASRARTASRSHPISRPAPR
jgi:hypothetical protein